MTIDLVEMSVPTSGEGSTNLQKLTGYIFNARGVNKRPSKAFGNIITKALAIIPVTHEVPAETANSQPLFEKRLQQQSSSKFVKWEASNFSPGRTFDTVRCIKDSLGVF